MKKKMKILLAANMYPSKQYPHYGVFVQNTEMILQTMEQVSIKRVVLKKTDSTLLRLITYACLYIRLIFWSVTRRYDILYGHFLSHLALPLLVVRALNKHIKIIVNVHGNDVVPDQTKDEKWIPLVKKVLPCVDELIVPSAYFKKVLIHDYAMKEADIAVFPSGGVNAEVFHLKAKDVIYGKYHLDPAKKYIGYVSRIEKNKGWDTFLHMAATFKEREDIVFLIVGDGDEAEAYQAMVNALDLERSIVKYNLLSQSEIADLFNIMEAFCFPTYRKSDSLGLVGIEAMACGAMVIASDQYGPSTYMINGVNGFTFPAADAMALSERIQLVMELSSSKKEVIRKHALETAKQYDKDQIASVLIDIFEKWR